MTQTQSSLTRSVRQSQEGMSRKHQNRSKESTRNASPTSNIRVEANGTLTLLDGEIRRNAS